MIKKVSELLAKKNILIIERLVEDSHHGAVYFLPDLDLIQNENLKGYISHYPTTFENQRDGIDPNDYDELGDYVINNRPIPMDIRIEHIIDLFVDPN